MESEKNHTSTQSKTPNPIQWTTFEELVVAYAVKINGLNRWSVVARELQRRLTQPNVTVMPFECRLKYGQLKRRFSASPATEANPVPWFDQLRHLHLTELYAESDRSPKDIIWSLDMRLILGVKEKIQRHDKSN